MKQKTTLFIKDLTTECHIGVSDEERNKKQKIIINIVFDIQYQNDTDSIDETVNYKTVYEGIVQIIQESKFNLIESLAKEIMEYILGFDRVRGVTVRIEKPQKFPHTKSVGVEITKEK